MRSFIFKIILSSILCISSIQANSTKNHVIKFYLDSVLMQNGDFAKNVLPKYVEDMNRILEKNTNRRLVFDPEIGIVLAEIQPFSNQSFSPMPPEDFEVWAYVLHTDREYSYGGYAAIDISGAGGLGGLYWTKIYDPDNLGPDEIKDYWTQINNMLHEIAHVFNAGMGEYYSLAQVQDTTKTPPLLDIRLSNSEDSFWNDKTDFLLDPLLRNAVYLGNYTRQELLELVRYSDLTAKIMRENYRNGFPQVDLQNINVFVKDEKGNPLTNANVKIWSMVGHSPYDSKIIFDGYSDAEGKIIFDWQGSGTSHNNYDFLRLIKVYKDGYVASAKYISIYDADIEKLLRGNNIWNVILTMKKNNNYFVPFIKC